MRKSLKKSRKPIGAIFRHAVNKISPNSEKLILEALTNIKKTVPEPLKKTLKEVSQEVSNVQQRSPMDKYDTFHSETPKVSPIFQVDPETVNKMRPMVQYNKQLISPISKVPPMFKFDQSKVPVTFHFEEAALSNVSQYNRQSQTHPDGGSIHNTLNKIGYLKSKSKSNLKKNKRLLSQSRRPLF
jgi:hypothetical protein